MNNAATDALEALERLEIRAGTVIRAKAFPEAHRPAYKLWVDFGPQVGVLTSSARITDLYDPEGLVGRQVLGATNLPPRRIGPFVSECLVMGFSTGDGVALATPDRPVANGERLY